MSTSLVYILGLASLFLVIYMITKKFDIKITLFAVGLLLMLIASFSGIELIEESQGRFIDPLIMIIDQFKKTLTSSGLIILILGGYTAYMNHIGANKVTIHTLTKPLSKIRSPYILVPIVFLLGNLLSLVIPSASNLSLILLATLYPVLKQSGMGTLTAAAVIATTATVMPTPLGADNVAVAAELGIPVTEYVFKYHAIVSIPTLLLMAIVHMVWQKRCDSKLDQVKEEELQIDEVEKVEGTSLYKAVYTILPLLPIIILLFSFFLNSFEITNVMLSVEVVVLISFVIAIVCELIRLKNGQKVLEDTESFFNGMGNSMGIVVILVAASTFVNGLKSIGLISELQLLMENTSASGFVLPLILVLLTTVIVLISGSGVALFYAMVPLMVPLANAAGISPFAVTVPMGLAGNLLRAVSPFSAVVIIVAGATKTEPFDIVKRTSVPMIVGTVFMFVLSMILFL